MPLLPFLAQSMGATSFRVGFMQSFFSLMQVFGTTALGYLSDRVGRRIVLLVCLGTTGVTLVLFGLAQHYGQLLFFRGLDGFFSGTVGVAQAFIADLVGDDERTDCMSKVGAAIGVGFILGPGVGGVLSDYGIQTVAFTAACFTFFNTAIAVYSLPLGVVPKAKPPEVAKVGRDPSQSLGNLLQQRPAIAVFYGCHFLFFLAMGFFSGIFALCMKDSYKMNGRRVGVIFMIAGISMLVFQMLFTKRLVKLIGDKRTLLFGIYCRVVAFALICFLRRPWVPYVMAITFIGGGAFFLPVSASWVAGLAPMEMRGAVMGGLQSIGALGNFLGPMTAGWLYGYDPPLPFGIATGISVAGLLLAAFGLPREPEKNPEGEASTEPAAPSETHLLTRKRPKLLRQPTVLERMQTGDQMSFPMAFFVRDLGGGLRLGPRLKLRRCSTSSEESNRPDKPRRSITSLL